MANTYTALNYHLVFSPKDRQPWLTEKIRERLWPYLGGIACENKMTALAVGGVSDHVHMLLAVPASMALAKGVQLVKGGSSHWLKASFPNMATFAWQDGYAAFTVSESWLEATRAYIRDQEVHHHTRTFAEENRAYLKRHRIPFDERFLLG